MTTKRRRPGRFPTQAVRPEETAETDAPPEAADDTSTDDVVEPPQQDEPEPQDEPTPESEPQDEPEPAAQDEPAEPNDGEPNDGEPNDGEPEAGEAARATGQQLSFDQVCREVEQLVAERPNYTYFPPYRTSLDCLYVHVVDDELTPGCIIGHWLHRFHGYALTTLRDYEGARITTMARRILDIQLDPDALAFLEDVQSGQDGRHTWSDAYTSARDKMLSF